MAIAVLIWAAVLATSVISGMLGMAGGMILMAVLVALVSVASAMMIHGAVQATSNGSRAWFLRQHIQWRILPPYIAGAAIAFGAFTLLAIVPPAGLILLVIGLFPWLGRILPSTVRLNVANPATAVTCGGVVTGAQLLAGVSGPLLDVFYLNSPLSRQAVVATKAVTQTLGHVLKLVYYGGVVGVAAQHLRVAELSAGGTAALYVLAIVTAIVGARIGTRLLDRWNDARFRQVSAWVILGIATVCIVQGMRSLWISGM